MSTRWNAALAGGVAVVLIGCGAPQRSALQSGAAPSASTPLSAPTTVAPEPAAPEPTGAPRTADSNTLGCPILDLTALGDLALTSDNARLATTDDGALLIEVTTDGANWTAVDCMPADTTTASRRLNLSFAAIRPTKAGVVTFLAVPNARQARPLGWLDLQAAHGESAAGFHLYLATSSQQPLAASKESTPSELQLFGAVREAFEHGTTSAIGVAPDILSA